MWIELSTDNDDTWQTIHDHILFGKNDKSPKNEFIAISKHSMHVNLKNVKCEFVKNS